MRGVMFKGNREAEIREFSDPHAGPGEAVVKIRASGLCGTDLHRYRAAEWACMIPFTLSVSLQLGCQGFTPCVMEGACFSSNSDLRRHLCRTRLIELSRSGSTSAMKSKMRFRWRGKPRLF